MSNIDHAPKLIPIRESSFPREEFLTEARKKLSEALEERLLKQLEDAMNPAMKVHFDRLTITEMGSGVSHVYCTISGGQVKTHARFELCQD